MKKFFSAANALTTIHFILFFPFVYFLFSGNKTTAIIILFIGFITDIFDGYFARKYNQATQYGRAFDISIDSLFLGAIMISAIMRNYLPLFWAAAYIIPTISLIIFNIIYYVKNKKFKRIKNSIDRLNSIVNNLIFILLLIEINYKYMVYSLITYWSMHCIIMSFILNLNKTKS